MQPHSLGATSWYLYASSARARARAVRISEAGEMGIDFVAADLGSALGETLRRVRKESGRAFAIFTESPVPATPSLALQLSLLTNRGYGLRFFLVDPSRNPARALEEDRLAHVRAGPDFRFTSGLGSSVTNKGEHLAPIPWVFAKSEHRENYEALGKLLAHRTLRSSISLGQPTGSYEPFETVAALEIGQGDDDDHIED